MIKRAFDFILALLGLVILSPVLLLLAILILFVDGRPVIFTQLRIGRGGRPFKMFKFRSMRQTEGASLTIGADMRITPMGRILRKTKLDEFPQLVNVLKGEMSFVGPRPEIEEFVRLYSPDQRRVLELYPGITDPASLKYISESDLLAQTKDPHRFYVETIMPDKIRLNLEYAKSANVLTDFTLILKTIFKSIGP